MFALTADAAPDLFDHAAGLLGADPRELVRRDGANIFYNHTGQILCTLQAVSARCLLDGLLPNRLVIAGYSVGELAAWGVAGAIDPIRTLDLASARAQAMDEVSDANDGMLFLRGLTLEEAERVSRRHGCAVAIVNPGDAYVLAGPGKGLDAIVAELGARGIKTRHLGVHVASHIPRLAAASTVFAGVLAASGAKRLGPSIRLLSGIDGAGVADPASGLDKLARQLSTTIHWADCLESCVEAGASAFLELGPCRALAEMARITYPDIPSRALDDFRSLDGVRLWLEKQR